MSPELQKVANDALLMLMPVFATWVVAKIRKAARDINASFIKMRAHEEHMGIETKVEGKKASVSPRQPSPRE